MKDITTTTFLLTKYKIMCPTGQCLLGVTSKYNMVSYDQETNTIHATYSYIQNILDEVLYMKTIVKKIIVECRQTKQKHN